MKNDVDTSMEVSSSEKQKWHYKEHLGEMAKNGEQEET